MTSIHIYDPKANGSAPDKLLVVRIEMRPARLARACQNVSAMTVVHGY